MPKFIFSSVNFNTQFSCYEARLIRLAFSWCNDRTYAEKLVDQTRPIALGQWEKIDTNRQREIKLFKILHQLLADLYLAEDSALGRIDISSNTGKPGVDANTKQHSFESVQQFVSVLPLSQRQVLTLVDLEACSYLEISEILHIRPRLVMHNLSQARATLIALVKSTENI